jgi:hypothetical protein
MIEKNSHNQELLDGLIKNAEKLTKGQDRHLIISLLLDSTNTFMKTAILLYLCVLYSKFLASVDSIFVLYIPPVLIPFIVQGIVTVNRIYKIKKVTRQYLETLKRFRK